MAPIGRMAPMDAGFFVATLDVTLAPWCFTNLTIRDGWTDRTNRTDGRFFRTILVVPLPPAVCESNHPSRMDRSDESHRWTDFLGATLEVTLAPWCFTNLTIRHGWTDRTNRTDGRIFWSRFDSIGQPSNVKNSR